MSFASVNKFPLDMLGKQVRFDYYGVEITTTIIAIDNITGKTVVLGFNADVFSTITHRGDINQDRRLSRRALDFTYIPNDNFPFSITMTAPAYMTILPSIISPDQVCAGCSIAAPHKETATPFMCIPCIVLRDLE